MIGFWRKRKTIAVHLVFWPIILVFVIWGVEKFDNPAGGAAVIVNGDSISYAQYRNALSRMIDFYAQMFGGNFDEKVQRQYRIKEAVLQQLISKELIAQQAKQMGLQVTDSEVRSTITSIPAFQKDGRFSRENYEGYLRYSRLNAGQFESDLRKDALVEKTRTLVEGMSQKSDGQVAKEKELQSQKWDLDYIKIENTALSQNLKVSDSELKTFLVDSSHQNKIKEYYDLHRGEFSTPERVKAQHILIKAAKGNSDEEAKARTKMNEILKQLKNNNFGELAKKYSEDPGSKNKNGELGWFEKGRMVPEFENAAFGLPVGKVSDLIQTNYGFHLIKVEDRQKAKTTEFNEARPIIAKRLIAEAKSDRLLNQVEKQLQSNPETAIKQLQSQVPLKWENTGVFSLGDNMIPKLGSEPSLIEEIVKLSGKTPYSSKLLKMGEARYILKYKPVNEKSKSASDKKVPNPLSPQETREVFSTWAQNLMEKATVKTNPRLLSGEEAID